MEIVNEQGSTPNIQININPHFETSTTRPLVTPGRIRAIPDQDPRYLVLIFLDTAMHSR